MAQPSVDEPAGGRTLRLLLVPGVTPTSWTRTWAQRLPDVGLELVHHAVAAQHAALVAGEADAGLVRLPVDRDVLSAIPLYTEASVVVLPQDHLLTALDEVTVDDLAEETLLVPQDDVLGWADAPGEPSLLDAPATTADAVELVASGVGLLVVPQSLARLHHRRDLTYRPVPEAPGSRVALAWLTQRSEDELIEELIGIVRGRTVNSSRGRGRGRDEAPEAPAAREGRGGAGRGRSGGKPATGAGAAKRPAGSRRSGPSRPRRPR